MLASLKRSVAATLQRCGAALAGTRVGMALGEGMASSLMTRTRRVSHRGIELMFTVPNGLNKFRVETFSTKEPETLAWLDAIPNGAVVWDIGANVGLYSCYAAKARCCRVIAFEPSVFNLELLARNVFVNGLTDRVTIVPLPLFERLTESTLNMTSTLWGGALSSFEVMQGFDGRPLSKVFEFRTVGIPMDDFVTRLTLPQPDFIKMDVDGIEHLILRGGPQVLKRVTGISVEINDDFAEQAADSRRSLEAAGLRLACKAHSQLMEDNASFSRTFNQVWTR